MYPAVRAIRNKQTERQRGGTAEYRDWMSAEFDSVAIAD